MFVVKSKDSFIKYGDDGLIYKVKNVDEATKLHTEKITKVFIKDLLRKNYSELSYIEIQ